MSVLLFERRERGGLILLRSDISVFVLCTFTRKEIGYIPLMSCLTGFTVLLLCTLVGMSVC